MNLEFDETLRRQNYLGPIEISNADLIHVCIAISPANSLERDRFFVLTKAELQTVCVRGHSTWMEKHDWIRPKNPQSYHIAYRISDLLEFENRWELITQRLAAVQSNAVLESEKE